METIQFDFHNPILVKDLPNLLSKFDNKGKPIPFSLIAITCNYSRNTGGEILILKNVIEYRHVKIIEYEDKFITLNPNIVPKIPKRLKDRIRILYNPEDDTIRNVNLRYITHFKGKNDAAFRRIHY